MKKSLPRLKIDLQNILLRADGLQGVITYPSDIQSTGYAASTESVLIISGEMGYLGIR